MSKFTEETQKPQGALLHINMVGSVWLYVSTPDGIPYILSPIHINCIEKAITKNMTDFVIATSDGIIHVISNDDFIVKVVPDGFVVPSKILETILTQVTILLE